MPDVDLDALEQVLSWVPESAEQLKKCQHYETGDEQAPFMSEAWLYNLLGKDDARSFLRRMNALIAELRRLRAQTPCFWTQDDDGIWHTGCGKAFAFDTDGPAANGFTRCPYCGQPLKEGV